MRLHIEDNLDYQQAAIESTVAVLATGENPAKYIK